MNSPSGGLRTVPAIPARPCSNALDDGSNRRHQQQINASMGLFSGPRKEKADAGPSASPVAARATTVSFALGRGFLLLNHYIHLYIVRKFCLAQCNLFIFLNMLQLWLRAAGILPLQLMLYLDLPAVVTTAEGANDTARD